MWSGAKAELKSQQMVMVWPSGLVDLWISCSLPTVVLSVEPPGMKTLSQIHMWKERMNSSELPSHLHMHCGKPLLKERTVKGNLMV